MDIDMPSSSIGSAANRQSSPAQRQQQRFDPLAFNAAGQQANANANGALNSEDDGMAGSQAQDEDLESSRRRQARPRNLQNQEEIPPVVDGTGERLREQFASFLESYVPPSNSGSPDPDGDRDQNGEVYIDQIKALKDYGKTTLFVDFAHLLDYDEVFAVAVADQYYRFQPYLRRALLDLVNTYIPGYLYLNAHVASTASSGLVPRDFTVSFYNLTLVSGIRELRTSKIGKLVSISGTVTRTSEVRPELLYGAFTCQECKNTVRDVEQQFKYTEPVMCRTATCQNRREWELNVEQSRFCDWQKVRIQENANEIPTGSMPRSLDVILRSEIVERAKAGDKCIFTGSFVVVPDVSQLGVPGVNAAMQREGAGGGRTGEGVTAQGVTGLKSLGVRDLTYKTAFLACMVQSADSRISSGEDDGEGLGTNPEELMDSLTSDEKAELEQMVLMDDIYSRLVQSIAPTVYGHDIVKKGVLLQLMGGVHKQTAEGIHLRGDINVCVVGDPSTSKSQFLKYVCGFLPRAVYTSGKASSAAGLTAAVVKDEETGEFTIEAGALMLADNGICAIDEFDKMDISDQVAIHEAMEQQTISIAKAGIQATLNARTSILAAANPVGGRYNRKQTLRQNVAMSAPIMSRFDLFFVVLDECNEQTDMHIAQHIVNVHRFREAALTPEFSTEAMQRYIRYARTFQPKLTPQASDVLVEKYRMLRQDDSGAGKNSYRITVRQLESMIRLSEAIARANCRQEITPAFVREAYALLKQSIIHVEKDDIDFEDEDDEDEVEGNRTINGQRNRSTLPSSTPDAMMQDEDESQSMDEEAADGQARSSSVIPGTGQATDGSGTRKKVKITYDRFMEMMNLVVLKVHEVETETMEGYLRSEMIEWYLEQREDQIESMDQLDDERELINKVLNKMIKDEYLIELRGNQYNEDESQPTTAEGSSLVGETMPQDLQGESNQSDPQSSTSAAAAASQAPRLLLHPRIDVDTIGSQ